MTNCNMNSVRNVSLVEKMFHNHKQHAIGMQPNLYLSTYILTSSIHRLTACEILRSCKKITLPKNLCVTLCLLCVTLCNSLTKKESHRVTQRRHRVTQRFFYNSLVLIPYHQRHLIIFTAAGIYLFIILSLYHFITLSSLQQQYE